MSTCVGQQQLRNTFAHNTVEEITKYSCVGLQQPYDQEIHLQKYSSWNHEIQLQTNTAIMESRNTCVKQSHPHKAKLRALVLSLGQKSPDIPDADELDTNSSQNHHHR